jgi:hypothetical protein
MSVLPCQESKLDSSVVQPSHYIDWATFMSSEYAC